MLPWDLDKAIPKYDKRSSAPLPYKYQHHVIIGDDGWTMLEHPPIHRAPHICGKTYDLQNKIYDLNVITGEYPIYLVNRGYLPNKRILIYN